MNSYRTTAFKLPGLKPARQVPLPSAGTSEYEQDGFTVRVIRSARRQRTVSARLVSYRSVEVRAPSRLTEGELQRIVQTLLEGIKSRQSRQRAVTSDESLMERANELNKRYLNNKLRWRSITFVGNQKQRYGSCTPQQGTIRISERLKHVPLWVLDYVIIHELAHLAEAGHSAAFWQLVNRYEKSERARGYLMALQFQDDDTADGEVEG